MLSQLSAEIRAHEWRADDFSFNNKVLKAPFYEVGPTLLDCVRAELFTEYETYEVGNRFTKTFDQQALPFNELFTLKFGNSWKLQFCGVQVFLDFVKLCALMRIMSM